MRDIKFRAWLKDEKEYFEWMDDFFSDMSPVMGYGSSIDHECIELEQYTGLKDKNGTEIYEGDIIQILGRSREVIFSKGRFTIKNDLPYVFDERYESCEIIGNIHQNPELLK